MAPHPDALVRKILPTLNMTASRDAKEDMDVEDDATPPRVVHTRQKPHHRWPAPTMVLSGHGRRRVGVG
jgi:hypothetical protein